jgi:translocation and assembly module TamA
MLLLYCLAMLGSAARAAETQPYNVSIARTGDGVLDAALKQGSQLYGLRERAPAGPFAIIMRAKADLRRLETVLHSFGYYEGKVTISVAGRPIEDPTLPNLLQQVPQGKTVDIKIAVARGPLFRLGKIRVLGAVPTNVRAKLDLFPGEPAIAADVIAAAARLLRAMEEDGHPLARVEPPIAKLNLPGHRVDITFKAETGRRARIGAILLTGLKSVNERFVRKRLRLHAGELFQPSKIERARRDLAELGVFSSVSVTAGKRIGPGGHIPITFAFVERPKFAVGLTAAFSTDLGGSLQASWSDRNLLGNAERLDLSAAATGLGGTAVTGLGYDISAKFVKPDFLRRDQSLEFDAVALKQDLQAYDQQAAFSGVSIHRALSPEWRVSLGISAEQERILQEGVDRTYTLVSLPATAKYDSTGLNNLLLDPTHGVRAALTATPTQSFGRTCASFAILEASASSYFDLNRLGISRPGRSIIALRGLVGSVAGASQFELPPDQRFYGGGSATIRGYRYQSVGPLFPDGNPIGGTAIDAATLEFRQRLFGNFGAAAFVDGGQVSAANMPFSGSLRIGVGAGLRYYTPIGPIRLDIALPVNPPPGADAFELYIGLGQAF